MSGKCNVSLRILHVQRYKFVDLLYTDMQNSNEYPDSYAGHFHPTTFLETAVDSYCQGRVQSFST